LGAAITASKDDNLHDLHYIKLSTRDVFVTCSLNIAVYKSPYLLTYLQWRRKEFSFAGATAQGA